MKSERFLVDDSAIKQRWKNWFYKLFNEHSIGNLEDIQIIDLFIILKKIKVQKVQVWRRFLLKYGRV